MSENSSEQTDWSVIIAIGATVLAFVFGGLWIGLGVLVGSVVALGWKKRHDGPFPTSKRSHDEPTPPSGELENHPRHDYGHESIVSQPPRSVSEPRKPVQQRESNARKSWIKPKKVRGSGKTWLGYDYPKAKRSYSIGGDSYEGEERVMFGRRDGQGIYTWANGTKFEGEWKRDKQHGKGTQTYPTGDKYVGDWQDGKQHGQGTYTWVDGRKYVGEWKDSVKWEGVEYDKDGRVVGTYAEGVYTIS